MNDNYFNSKEFKNILSLFENSQKEGKDCILSSEEFTDIAEYYNARGLQEKAVNVAQYALYLYPKASAPLLFLAKSEVVINRDLVKAREYLKIISDTNYVDFFTIYAETFLMENNKEEALRWLENATLVLEDDDLQDLYVDSAFLLLDYNMPEDAEAWARKIKDTESDEFIKLKARFCVGKGEFSKAISLLEKLIDNDPFCYDYWVLLSSVQLSCNMYSEALTSIEYAIAIDSNIPDAYMYQGNAFLKLCNYDKALEAYCRYTEGSNSDVGYMLQGRCLFYMQNNSKAIEMLKIAENKCPNDRARQTDIYKDLAIIYGWVGDYSNAMLYVNKIKSHGIIDSELFVIEGGILLNMEKFEDATQKFVQGYTLAESQEAYLLQVAVAYYEHRYDSAAYKMLKEVHRINPENKQYAPYFAACCFYLGKYDEFIKALEIAVNETPDEAHTILADIFPAGLETYDYVKYAKCHKFNGNNRKPE